MPQLFYFTFYCFMFNYLGKPSIRKFDGFHHRQDQVFLGDCRTNNLKSKRQNDKSQTFFLEGFTSKIFKNELKNRFRTGSSTDILLDPEQLTGDAGVDSGVASLATLPAEGGNTCKKQSTQ